MIVGFTGTQEGMTEAQKVVVASIVTAWKIEEDAEYHHGCCIGADDEFRRIIRVLFRKNVTIVGHPPINRSKVSNLAIINCDKLYPAKDYLERNSDIAYICDRLIAAPKEPSMVVRSGTWSTVRYAMSFNKTIEVVKPDGSLLHYPK